VHQRRERRDRDLSKHLFETFRKKAVPLPVLRIATLHLVEQSFHPICEPLIGSTWKILQKSRFHIENNEAIEIAGTVKQLVHQANAIDRLSHVACCDETQRKLGRRLVHTRGLALKM